MKPILPFSMSMNDNHYTALAHEDRRAIVRQLRSESPTKVDVGLDGRDRDVMLVHQHLPLLVDAGLVEWDSDTRLVAKGPEFSELETIGESLGAVPSAEAD